MTMTEEDWKSMAPPQNAHIARTRVLNKRNQAIWDAHYGSKDWPVNFRAGDTYDADKIQGLMDLFDQAKRALGEFLEEVPDDPDGAA